MKSAKQIAFIIIGFTMIFLAVGLIFMKKSNDRARGGSSEGESGSVAFSTPISSLVFEAGACDIKVSVGDGEDYILDYEGLKYGTLTHELEGEELKISFKQNNNWTAKMFAEKDIDDQKITLTIPKGAMPDSALFEFGAAEINMEDVSAKKLYITVGAGELTADGLTATEFAKLNVGAGVFHADEVALANAELVCGVGEMKVSGSFYGDTTADCGVGAMELRVQGEQEEYRGELNCGLGEIDFGNIDLEGSGKQSYGTSSAERRMDIKCGIGEVDVRFYE